MSDQTIRLVFQTQYLENYGAHCWDGEGECPQRWKPKGGSTYVVPCTPEQLADADLQPIWQALTGVDREPVQNLCDGDGLQLRCAHLSVGKDEREHV